MSKTHSERRSPNPDGRLSDKMLDLSDMGEEELTRSVSSEFKRIVEDNMDLPFLVDSLVVDGRALQSIFKDDDLRDKFCEISDRCPTVVACRLSPIQVSSRTLQGDHSS